MGDHPELVPFGGACAVHWLRNANGRCEAMEYFTGLDGKSRASLVSRAQLIAAEGHHRLEKHGHNLKGRYRDLYEIKIGDHRFIGFRVGRLFMISIGAAKADRRRQDRDYERAMNSRVQYLHSINDG